MARKPPDQQLQVNFRMPASLKDKLQAAADASGRSLTAEIIKRLGESFSRDKSIIDILEDQREERQLYQSLVRGLMDAAGDRVPNQMRVLLKPLARRDRDDTPDYFGNLLKKVEAASAAGAGEPEDSE